MVVRTARLKEISYEEYGMVEGMGREAKSEK
jgi:hypothetical protein